MSAMAAIVPLSLFLVSVSPVAAELEPLEDGCLLQSTKERQLVAEEQQPVPGYTILCGGGGGSGCGCADNGPLVDSPTPADAVACAAACPSTQYPGFAFAVGFSPLCFCCNNLVPRPGLDPPF